MKDKLQLLINSEEKLTRSGFAEMLGIQPATISHILAGRNKPSYELLQKILMRFPNVSSDWLMLDRGEMLRDSSLTPSGIPRNGGNGGNSGGWQSDATTGTTGATGATAAMSATLASGTVNAPTTGGIPNATYGTMPNLAAAGGFRQGTIFDAPDNPHNPHAPYGNPQGVPAASPNSQTPRESNIPSAAGVSSVLSQPREGWRVERVVVFYSDKTFDTYIPKP